MPRVPFPNKNPDAWDTVYLDGILIPGVCTVRVTVSNGLDVQKSSGKHGASIVGNGRNPADIEIKVVVWDDEGLGQTDWDQLQTFIDLVWPADQRSDLVPFLIENAQCQLMNIDRVVLDTMTANPPREGGDKYELEIKLREFLDKTDDTTTKAKRLKPRAQQLADVVPSAAKPSTGNTGP